MNAATRVASLSHRSGGSSETGGVRKTTVGMARVGARLRRAPQAGTTLAAEVAAAIAIATIVGREAVVVVTTRGVVVAEREAVVVVTPPETVAAAEVSLEVGVGGETLGVGGKHREARETEEGPAEVEIVRGPTAA